MSVDNHAASKLSRRSEQAVERTVARAAWVSERTFSFARAVLFAAVLARFALITTAPPGAILMTAGSLGVGLVFSLAVVFAFRRPPLPTAILFASVAVDAMVCLLALAPNVLWPTRDHYGILVRADTAVLLIATMVAGLRLSPGAALFGGALNGAGLLVLVALDRSVSGDRFAVQTPTVSLYVLWIGASAAAAFLLARGTRTLAVRGAEEALRAQGAEQVLWSMLGDHHELCSRLASLLIEAETLERTLERSEPSRELAKLRVTTASLREDLALVREVVDGGKSRALDRLKTRAETPPAPVGAALEVAIVHAQSRSPRVRFQLDCDDIVKSIAVVVPRPALERMLSLLLDNACEGDGSRGASTVRVHAQAVDGSGCVRIVVEDDGPGVPSDVGPEGSLPTTTKQGVRGLGLAIVRSLVEAFGGELELRRRPERGTVATLVVPVEPSAGAEPARSDRY
ncbi:MAG: ATP-binding protein [Polyangiaceae bacterium]